MNRFVRLFSAIAVAMCSAQALAQSTSPPKGYRPEDIVSLMSLLHREAFAAPSYSQLFEGCTGTQPSGELGQVAVELRRYAHPELIAAMLFCYGLGLGHGLSAGLHVGHYVGHDFANAF
jgi:hypothetical protein